MIRTNFFSYGIILAGSIFSLFMHAEQDIVNGKSFVIVIPSYNNAQWYQRNLDSIFSQDYPNYRVIYIDDCSTDGTGALVENYIKERGKEDKVLLIKNDTCVGQLANTYHAIWQCDPHSIIAVLDGDDWLADSTVLSYLNSVYQNPNVWLTYGQNIIFRKVFPYSKQVINRNSFRQAHWNNQHLRTFYAALFHKIKQPDLLYKGQFFRYAADCAYMYPMFEMAGHHIRFISKVLYVYNRANPTNANKQRETKLQTVRNAHIIRRRKKYSKLQSLFIDETNEQESSL